MVEVVQSATNVFAYAYDVAGRLAEVYTNGGLASTYEYDANGNRTNAVVHGAAWSAEHDAQDRLVSCTGITNLFNECGELTNSAVLGIPTGLLTAQFDPDPETPGDYAIRWRLNNGNEQWMFVTVTPA